MLAGIPVIVNFKSSQNRIWKKIETDPHILNTPFMKQSMFEAEKEISNRKSQMEKDGTQIQHLCEKFNDMFKNVRNWRRKKCENLSKNQNR